MLDLLESLNLYCKPSHAFCTCWSTILVPFIYKSLPYKKRLVQSSECKFTLTDAQLGHTLLKEMFSDLICSAADQEVTEAECVITKIRSASFSDLEFFTLYNHANQPVFNLSNFDIRYFTRNGWKRTKEDLISEVIICASVHSICTHLSCYFTTFTKIICFKICYS